MTYYINGIINEPTFFLPSVPYGMIVSSGIDNIIKTIQENPPIYFKNKNNELDEPEQTADQLAAQTVAPPPAPPLTPAQTPAQTPAPAPPPAPPLRPTTPLTKEFETDKNEAIKIINTILNKLQDKSQKIKSKPTDASVNILLKNLSSDNNDKPFELHRIVADGSCFYCSIITAIKSDKTILDNYKKLIEKYTLNNLSFNDETDLDRQDVLKLRLLIFLFGLENKNKKDDEFESGVTNYNFDASYNNNNKNKFITNILKQQATTMEIILLRNLLNKNDLNVNIFEAKPEKIQHLRDGSLPPQKDASNNILLIYYNTQNLSADKSNHYALITREKKLIFNNEELTEINNFIDKKKGGKKNSKLKVKSKKAKKYRKTNKTKTRKQNK